jgi:hypothetical protein
LFSTPKATFSTLTSEVSVAYCTMLSRIASNFERLTDYKPSLFQNYLHSRRLTPFCYSGDSR